MRRAKRPGKILLIGEHAVVYGHPAIAIPLRGVRARAEVELTPGGGIEMSSEELKERVHSAEEASERLAPLYRLAESVAGIFGEQKQGMRIRLHSTIPMRRGMGSGAAIAVALVRGVCGALGRKLDTEQVCELAHRGRARVPRQPERRGLRRRRAGRTGLFRPRQAAAGDHRRRQPLPLRRGRHGDRIAHAPGRRGRERGARQGPGAVSIRISGNSARWPASRAR